MAGMTPEGLTIQRLPDIIGELENQAGVIWQDVVPAGDVVNVQENSAIGRMIGVVAPSLAELWEAIQDTYDAFNPNAAYGVSLDNLVQYTGISRLPPAYTTAQCLVSGTINTVIPAGSKVKARLSGNTFVLPTAVTINKESAFGIIVEVATVQNLTAYQITYQVGVASNVISYTSDASATVSEILDGLKGVIESAHPSLTVSRVGDTLIVNRLFSLSAATFSLSANLAATQATKLVIVQAQEYGPIVQAENTIDTITTPVFGWNSVTNPYPANVGRLSESDEELRERFRNTKYERSTNIIDSLYSALLSVDGVTEVLIYENDTATTDTNGLPPHSFMPLIYGGLDEDLADKIWLNKPLGIKSHGDVQVEILDSKGKPHTIGLQRPTLVPIYVTLDIEVDTNIFPGDGVEQIKQNIVEYGQASYRIGDEVIYSRLFTPINKVDGFYVSGTMQIGRSLGAMAASNITIDFDEIAAFSTANITVNIV